MTYQDIYDVGIKIYVVNILWLSSVTFHYGRLAVEGERTKKRRITKLWYGTWTQHTYGASEWVKTCFNNSGDDEKSLCFCPMFPLQRFGYVALRLPAAPLLAWRTKRGQRLGRDSNREPRQLLRRGTQRSPCVCTKNPRETFTTRWELLIPAAEIAQL